jgi:hypothetical protein
MKKLLAYLVVLIFVLGITIVGRPITQGEYKGEDFFIVDLEDAVDLGGFWMKNGNVVGFGTMTKEKATELFKKWNLQQRKTKTEI